MLRKFLRVKIKGGRVTDTQLHYEGSITLDGEIMERSGLLPGEEVLVLNLNNGARFTTYLIEGERNSGIICLNGPAARLGYPGDEVIILSFVYLEDKEIPLHRSKLVILSPDNRIEEIREG